MRDTEARTEARARGRAEAVSTALNGDLFVDTELPDNRTMVSVLLVGKRGVVGVLLSISERPEEVQSALQALAGRHDAMPAVLTCSALHGHGVEEVWQAVARRHDRLAATGGLAERRRRQNLRWLWALVEDRLRQVVRTHPVVQAIQGDLEREVLAGTVPASAAARRILEAFGLPTPGSR